MKYWDEEDEKMEQYIQRQQAADEYVGHPQEIDEDLTVYCKREAFKDGALWQRNHVWHHADEEPTDREVCLTVNKRGSKDIVTYSKQFFYKGHVIAEPCKLYRLTEIEMWAYIKDLLPDTDK